jgi:AcrR family transcriptional regulator
VATGSVPADDAAPSAARRVSAAERRAQYLRVAAELVTEHGADAVTMEAVAAGAAVNKALLYRQFSNRAELLLTLFEQETGELDRRVATAIEGAGDFDSKVRAWISAWFSYMGRRGTLYYRATSTLTPASEPAVSSNGGGGAARARRPPRS